MDGRTLAKRYDTHQKGTIQKRLYLFSRFLQRVFSFFAGFCLFSPFPPGSLTGKSKKPEGTKSLPTSRQLLTNPGVLLLCRFRRAFPVLFVRKHLGNPVLPVHKHHLRAVLLCFLRIHAGISHQDHLIPCARAAGSRPVQAEDPAPRFPGNGIGFQTRAGVDIPTCTCWYSRIPAASRRSRSTVTLPT